jgi:glycosyltransferase involved in cell wall biosynthesis
MNHKLTVIIRFGQSYRTLGNACRIDMVRYLASNFNSTIITDQIEAVQHFFPGLKIISIKSNTRGKVPLLNEFLHWKYLAKIINSITSDGVFMFHDDSPAALWLQKPVFQYIHQYGRRNLEGKGIIREWLKNHIRDIKHRLFIRGFKKSSQNFVVSPFLIDYFKNEGVEKLELIPHAIELSTFQKPVIKGDHRILSELYEKGWYIISYTGWVTENRGFQLMMDTIIKTKELNPKVVLVIAGADSYFSERIAEYQKEFQLHNNIINYGVVDASIIPGILHFSHVCLSFWDSNVPGFQLAPPQKIFEYFAAGKPVICNKVQTHSMFVENRKTGFVLDMNPTEVSEAIIELINNKELYRQMCVNVMNEASKYDMEVVYSNMVRTINQKLNGHQNLV